MKVALIQASPKSKNSASRTILDDLRKYFTEEFEIKEFHLKNSFILEEEKEELFYCDSLVFAFPLYVDGIPSHLLRCLTELELFFKQKEKREITVYVLINCGFYEGRQNVLALEMMENWCIKSGLLWGQGIGIGAGGMLLSVINVPVGHGPKKNLGTALQILSKNMIEKKSDKNLLITPNIPRFLYKFMAEFGWRKQIKVNGLKVKDLYLKKQI